MFIGKQVVQQRYLYIHPFYKNLAGAISQREPSAVGTQTLVKVLQLDCSCPPTEPSMIVEEYWDAWWSDSTVLAVGSQLDGFRLFRSLVGPLRGDSVYCSNLLFSIL